MSNNNNAAYPIPSSTVAAAMAFGNVGGGGTLFGTQPGPASLFGSTPSMANNNNMSTAVGSSREGIGGSEKPSTLPFRTRNGKPINDAEFLKELKNNNIKMVGNYVLGQTIGEGTYGKVKLATHVLTSQTVAIKIVDKIHAPTVIREISTWRNLHHPNIAQLYEVVMSENKIYMVMEYVGGGEIFDFVEGNGAIEEMECRRIFRQLCEAVRYCHDKNVVHRDLKLENILLDMDMNIKLIDFGFTREIDGRNKLMETYCGSTAYAAPEMISGQKYSGPAADIWSSGVILYTMVCGYLPFDDDVEARVHAKIMKLEYEFPGGVSEGAQDLISRILKLDPKERPTWDEIMGHSWLQLPEPQQEESMGSVMSSDSLPFLSRAQSATMQDDSIRPAVRKDSGGDSNTRTSETSLQQPMTGSLLKMGHRANGRRPSLPSSIQKMHDYISTLRKDEKMLIFHLNLLGFDTKAMMQSVQGDACDALSAFYYLSLERIRSDPDKSLMRYGVSYSSIERMMSSGTSPATTTAPSGVTTVESSVHDQLDANQQDELSDSLTHFLFQMHLDPQARSVIPASSLPNSALQSEVTLNESSLRSSLSKEVSSTSSASSDKTLTPLRFHQKSSPSVLLHYAGPSTAPPVAKHPGLLAMSNFNSGTRSNGNSPVQSTRSQLSPLSPLQPLRSPLRSSMMPETPSPKHLRPVSSSGNPKPFRRHSAVDTSPTSSPMLVNADLLLQPTRRGSLLWAKTVDFEVEEFGSAVAGGGRSPSGSAFMANNNKHRGRMQKNAIKEDEDEEHVAQTAGEVRSETTTTHSSQESMEENQESEDRKEETQQISGQTTRIMIKQISFAEEDEDDDE